MSIENPTFEQSGLPDRGKLRAAFELGAASCEIYSDIYTFEDILKQAQILHRHCPDISDDFLASILLSCTVVRERLPDHPKSHLLPLEADYIEEFGLDILDRAGEISGAWHVDNPALGGLDFRSEDELKEHTPDMLKAMMAFMIANMQQIVEGRIDTYGYPQPDPDHYTRWLDLHNTTFNVAAGIVPTMDDEFKTLMPQARQVVAGWERRLD